MIRVKKKKKIKRKKIGNVKTTERTTKKGGNVSQVVNVYVTKGGGGRRKAPAQRPTFFQSQPQLFTANYDNTLLNQIQPIQDKYIKMFNTNNDLLNKLLTKQRTSDSSIQTDTLTNDKLFTKETQTAPEKIPVFRPADTQTEPISFNTTGTQSEPTLTRARRIQTEPIQSNVIETQTEPIQGNVIETQTEPTLTRARRIQTEPMIFNTIGTQSEPTLTRARRIQTEPIQGNVIETQTEPTLTKTKKIQTKPKTNVIETQTEPTPRPFTRPRRTQTDPSLFQTTGTQSETPLQTIGEASENIQQEEGDLADLLNPTRPQPQRVTGEIGSPQNPSLAQVKAKLKKKVKIRLRQSVDRERPNVSSDFIEGGGVDIMSPLEELEDLVGQDIEFTRALEERRESVNRTPIQQETARRLLEAQQEARGIKAQADKLVSQLNDIRNRAKANNIKMMRGQIPKTKELIKKQINYYLEQIAIKNRATSI